MSTNPGSTNQAGARPDDMDPAREDPAASDPMADEKVRLQLAIFEVTRDAEGKSLSEIRKMLLAAFSRHGVEPPPGTWMESVASSAYYGEPYIVDLAAAVAADAIIPAPDDDVRDRLASARQLQQEKLPAGIFPAQDEWELSPDEVTGGAGRQRRGAFRAVPPTAGASRRLLAAAGLAAAVLVAFVAARASRRPTPGSGKS